MPTKYTVAAGVISAPTDAFYQGSEVTAKALGIDQERFDHLVKEGAIVKAQDEAAGEGEGEGDPAAANDAQAQAAGIPPSKETTGIAGGAPDGTHGKKK
jgi:hypothetical protein